MEFNEDELPCSLDVGLKRVVDKIGIEINKVRQGKSGVSNIFRLYLSIEN